MRSMLTESLTRIFLNNLTFFKECNAYLSVGVHCVYHSPLYVDSAISNHVLMFPVCL